VGAAMRIQGVGRSFLSLAVVWTRFIAVQSEFQLPGTGGSRRLFICRKCGYIRRGSDAEPGTCRSTEHGQLRRANRGDVARDECRGEPGCRETVRRKLTSDQVSGAAMVLLACDGHRDERALV
jgi:hypothetical protein